MTVDLSSIERYELSRLFTLKSFRSLSIYSVWRIKMNLFELLPSHLKELSLSDCDNLAEECFLEIKRCPHLTLLSIDSSEYL